MKQVHFYKIKINKQPQTTVYLQSDSNFETQAIADSKFGHIDSTEQWLQHS